MTDSITINKTILATLVSCAQQHVDDIETGLEEGLYLQAENTDLPEKVAAVAAAVALIQATPEASPKTASKIPVFTVTHHVARLKEHEHVLKSILDVHGNGYNLSTELKSRAELIQAAYARLQEIFEVAARHHEHAQFMRLVVEAGLPDFTPYGMEANTLPPWADVRLGNELLVTVKVTGSFTSLDDAKIPGDYQFIVNLTRPASHAHLSEQEKTEIARKVLDEFHDQIGIAVLDDFEINVTLESGEIICEDLDELPTPVVASVASNW